ncbi:hypothetical protein TrLO_g12349 [Triparma laevis f. longispina]|uniref:Homeobox domain-containing protein n=2 Tax=Triparma laevis TaxID=1534972 RepID=A0A9W7FUU0_9STRA|nr:hypothetical protein TrLO_g12349 [Triparma laevis f. longispina]
MNVGKSTSLPTSTVEYLKNWILSPDHIQHPYPTELEKRKIMIETGIELKQLTNWFTNNRKRFWKPRVLASSLRKISAGSFSDTSSSSNPSPPTLPPSPPLPPYTKTRPTPHTDHHSPTGQITRTEIINIYILSPPTSQIPTIKDVTILSPKTGAKILRSEMGREIEYFFHKAVVGDRKKVQSRRDAEVVRVKKSLLRSYLNSIGERKDAPKKPSTPPSKTTTTTTTTTTTRSLRVLEQSNNNKNSPSTPQPLQSSYNPWLHLPASYFPPLPPPSLTTSSITSSDSDSDSLPSKRRRLTYDPAVPVVITPREEYIKGGIEWGDAMRREERERPSLEEAAILFGFMKGR